MSTKHTPGPWHVSNTYIFAEGRDTTDGGYMVASVSPFDPREEYQANACLIAAAPDMLEALEALEPMLVDPWRLGYASAREFLSQTRAAIAKAKGEST